MKHSLLPIARAIAGLALIGAAGLAAAQTPPPPPETTTSPAPATAATPTGKLVSTFSGFAGSEENAASLVNGLRTGSAITLTGSSTGTGGTVGETTTFTSPTKPMGYGNIRIAMSLAEAQLASQGITNPTPTQLQGALMGTTTGTGADATTTQGILEMRASGMGWGQIANSMGFKLGPVMSGKQTFTEAVAAGSTTTAAGTTAAGATSARGKSGVTTAGGSSAGKGGVTTASGSPGKSGVTTAGGSGGNAYGHGKSSVVTAAGGGGGGAAASGLGHGNAGGASAGVVSAAGGAGQGGGGGQGGGHGKGGGKP